MIFYGFSPRAIQVAALAQQAAKVSRRGYVGAEHLLAALLRVDSGFPSVILQAAGLAHDDVRAGAEQLAPPATTGARGSLPLAPGFARAVESARQASQNLGYDYVGLEHLLLALLDDGEGIAVRLMDASGADVGQVRRVLLDKMSRDPTPHGTAPLRLALSGSTPPLGYLGGQLHIVGVEVYDVETVIVWRLAPMPELGLKDPVRIDGTSDDEMQLGIEEELRAIQTVGHFDITDDMGTRYHRRHSGGGGNRQKWDGETTFVPAPSPSATRLIVTWHSSNLDLPLTV